MYLYHNLICQHCGNASQLRRETITRLFGFLGGPPNYPLAIGIVCSQCKLLETHFLNEDHPEHKPDDQVKLLPFRAENIFLVTTLECEQGICKCRLPVFARWSSKAMSSEDRQAEAATWRCGRLRCPNGHSIAKLDWSSSLLFAGPD